MNKRALFLSLLCLSLAACGLRNRNQNSATQTIQVKAPTTAPEPTSIPTLIPSAAVEPTVQQSTQPAPSPTAQPSPTFAPTVVLQSDPLGDQVENLLDQLESQNNTADQDLNNLSIP
jgi:hypothetical protein